jgi:hypothetical protein
MRKIIETVRIRQDIRQKCLGAKSSRLLPISDDTKDEENSNLYKKYLFILCDEKV